MQLQARRSQFGFTQCGKGATALFGVFFWLFLAFAASARSEESRSVLFLNSYGPEFAPYNFLTTSLRNDLTKKYEGSVDYYDASLASARYAEGGDDKAFVEYLQTLFHEHRLDLVIAIGAPAARFVQQYRSAIFPQIPMLLTAVEQRRLDREAYFSNDFVIAFSLDLPALVTNIMTVLPETESVEIVIGNSPNEKFWIGELKREFAQFESKVQFNYLNPFKFDDLVKRLSRTPPKTAILLGPFTVDGAGNVLQGDRTLARLRREANAPIFSHVDAYLGGGVIGGPHISLADMSKQAAELAAVILGGGRPSLAVTPPITFGVSVYDWRELQRWGISESILPTGSIVEYRSLGIWKRYSQIILLVVLITALQLFLILGLLANHIRLRKEQAERGRAESETHELSGRLIHAHEDERARLARELHDDVTQRLALLSIVAGQIEREAEAASRNARLRGMRDGLVRLSEDVHSLSYRLHPSILSDLGLSEALKSECNRVSETSAIDITCDVDELPRHLPEDAALCLFRIAQESLRNVTRHARATFAQLSVRHVRDGLQLVVRDDGQGFDPATSARKANLGQASMRQRIRHLGGDLTIESAPGKGAVISAWLPLRENISEPSKNLVS